MRYGLEIQRDQLLGATGVLPGLLSAIRAFCPPHLGLTSCACLRNMSRLGPRVVFLLKAA